MARKDAAARGTLTGSVIDSEGESVPGVVLTVTSAAGPPLTRVSNEEGRFTFYNLPPAETTVRAEMEGFETTTATADVQGGETATVEIKLTSAAVEEEASESEEEAADAEEDGTS